MRAICCLLLTPFLYIGCMTSPTGPDVPYDTIFVDISPDKTTIYFKVAFYLPGSSYCKVYINGEYNSSVHYGYARSFLVENGSLFKITYVMDSSKTDTLSRSCIARDSCTWRIE